MTGIPAGLANAVGDRYRIERRLGEGGMATVFLAQDLRHDRQVALKVLRPELAAALGAERFLLEIKITARLNHAHILPLLDSGEADGLLFYVMPYVEGETLRDRLSHATRLPVADALDLAAEVADALGSAHRQGLIHRDVKPENILLREGHAVVADFGIALAVTAAQGERLTGTGLSLGTPSYMSPEQIEGRDIDARTDIYQLGCVLYEMLTGAPPFEGPTPLSIAARHQTEPPPDPRARRVEIPDELAQLTIRCLAKDRDQRFQSAAELHAELARTRQRLGALPHAISVRSLWRRLRRPAVGIPAAVALAALLLLTTWAVGRQREIRWARAFALPEVERLIGENDVWRNLVRPYRLAVEAEAILGDDPALAALFSRMSMRVDVRTEPAGATVHYREYGDTTGDWELLGVTPLEDVRVPTGIFRWRLAKEGYDTVHAAASSWAISISDELIGPNEIVRTLDPVGTAPRRMVRVEAAQTPAGPLGTFFVGRHEVTNREYKEFVDAGGYAKREYWKHPFVRDGRALPWERAMAEFVDRAGLPGPSVWEAGDYPTGKADFPVSGVSWYEAAAFAEFKGMSLPTGLHWNVARGGFNPMVLVPQLGGFAVIAPFTNFGGQGPVEVGSLDGISSFGALDMAGNVREWCWNETDQGRLVRGGSWSDNSYEYGNERQAPPMDRSDRNGFRLAWYPEGGEPTAAALAPHAIAALPGPGSRRPVSDDVFAAYRAQYSYDPAPLHDSLEQRVANEEGWVHETVTFDAAYGGERVRAHLFLPVNAAPPYQTVVYFPGSAVTWTSSSADLEHYYEFTMFLSYLVRNGRAVVFPVFQGTFERGGPQFAGLQAGAPTHAYTEYFVQVVKDFRRTVDYLQSRPDIDATRLAYYGMSWGGWLGSVIPATEDRLRASVLISGGFNSVVRPEAQDVNYAPRVTLPTLMLNGRYDNLFLLESQIQPMFAALGTPADDKRLILYDTDHIPPRTEYIRETLAWFDTYLGPVRR